MKKQVIAGLAAAMICVGAVGGTFAYLTSVSAEVTNTFTVGSGVVITLDEADVTELGDLDGNERVTENSYKLIPGHDYVKDPTIHVADNSESCYVFVKVDNVLEGKESTDTTDDFTTIAEQMAAKGWKAVNGADGYYYQEEVKNAGEDIIVFENFKVSETLVEADLADLNGQQITIKACAVQSDGIESAMDAWAAVPEAFKTTTTTP